MNINDVDYHWITSIDSSKFPQIDVNHVFCEGDISSKVELQKTDVGSYSTFPKHSDTSHKIMTNKKGHQLQ